MKKLFVSRRDNIST